MTAKEFVTKKYPDAICKQFGKGKSGSKKHCYWVVFMDGKVEPLFVLSANAIARGKTESNAWVNAKNRIK